jgi:hypothetical protein
VTTYAEIVKLAAGEAGIAKHALFGFGKKPEPPKPLTKEEEQAKREKELDEKAKPGLAMRAAYQAAPAIAATTGALALAHWARPTKIKIGPELHEHFAKHLDPDWKDPGAAKGFMSKVKALMPNLWNKPPPGHSPEYLARELGKAKGYATMATKVIAPTASAAAGAMMALEGKPKSWTRRLAIPVAALGTLPTLVDEIAASKKGYGALKSYGKFAPDELKTMRRNLYKGLGSYGLHAAATVAPAALITLHKVMKERAQREEEEKAKKGPKNV